MQGMYKAANTKGIRTQFPVGMNVYVINKDTQEVVDMGFVEKYTRSEVSVAGHIAHIHTVGGDIIDIIFAAGMCNFTIMSAMHKLTDKNNETAGVYYTPENDSKVVRVLFDTYGYVKELRAANVNEVVPFVDHGRLYLEQVNLKRSEVQMPHDVRQAALAAVKLFAAEKYGDGSQYTQHKLAEALLIADTYTQPQMSTAVSELADVIIDILKERDADA